MYDIDKNTIIFFDTIPTNEDFNGRCDRCTENVLELIQNDKPYEQFMKDMISFGILNVSMVFQSLITESLSTYPSEVQVDFC